MVKAHWETAMPATSEYIRRRVPPIIGVAALFGWLIAYAEAMPRLAAGPLCSSRDDLFTLAGHCPACGVAAFLSLAFVASAALMRRPSPAAAPVRAIG
jgi:hypothetical protein